MPKKAAPSFADFQKIDKKAQAMSKAAWKLRAAGKIDQSEAKFDQARRLHYQSKSVLNAYHAEKNKPQRPVRRGMTNNESYNRASYKDVATRAKAKTPGVALSSGYKSAFTGKPVASARFAGGTGGTKMSRDQLASSLRASRASLLSPEYRSGTQSLRINGFTSDGAKTHSARMKSYGAFKNRYVEPKSPHGDGDTMRRSGGSVVAKMVAADKARAAAGTSMVPTGKKDAQGRMMFAPAKPTGTTVTNKSGGVQMTGNVKSSVGKSVSMSQVLGSAGAAKMNAAAAAAKARTAANVSGANGGGTPSKASGGAKGGGGKKGGGRRGNPNHGARGRFV